jgi:hypothetical protein
MKNGWQRRAVRVLIALSIAIHGVRVFGVVATRRQVRHMVDDQGCHRFNLRDTQIEAHVRAFLHDVLH